MKKYILILAVLLLLPGLLSAKTFAKTGTAGLQFLKFGIDARAIGMAEAYTAVTNDISSVYWNPAGLALNPQNQILFSHTEYVANIRHEFFAISKRSSIGTFAFFASALHMDWMDVYIEDSFDVPTGEQFTCYDLAGGLTYANSFTDKFAFGFTAKYLREKLDEYAVDGMSVDLGSLYNTGWKNVTIGMSLRNFGPNMKFELDNDGDGLIDEDREETPFKIPMNFSLGVSADIYRVDDNNFLIGSVQLDNCVDRKETYNLGFEYTMSTFKIRSGYQFEYDAAGYSGGFGWTIPTSFAIISIDYAYTDYGDLAENFIKTPHRLSIKLFY